MKARPHRWSAEELAWVEARAALPRRKMLAAFNAAFGCGVTLAALIGLCKRRGWTTGRSGRFGAGHTPANKGKTMPFNTASAATRFKPGRRVGRAAALYQPIGTERLSRYGYRERKVNDDMPLQRRWRAVHILRWEAEHGPVPQGHALKSLDGDRLNTAPANWVAIPRALLPRLNGRHGRGYDQAAPEVRPTIMMIAELEHAARQASKGTAQ